MIASASGAAPAAVVMSGEPQKLNILAKRRLKEFDTKDAVGFQSQLANIGLKNVVVTVDADSILNDKESGGTAVEGWLVGCVFGWSASLTALLAAQRSPTSRLSTRPLCAR